VDSERKKTGMVCFFGCKPFLGHKRVCHFCIQYSINVKYNAYYIFLTELIKKLYISAHLPKWKQILFTGGEKGDTTNIATKEVENFQMAFIRDTISSIILNDWGKLIVILTYLVYITLSIFGLSRLDFFFLPTRIFHEHTSMFKFYMMDEKYFPEYPHRLEVLITNPVDYSNLTIQSDINNLISQISHQQFMTTEFSENWLRDFTSWAKIYTEFEPIDISTEETFIDTLRHKYLNSNSTYALDITFNDNYTQILATRYILQIKGINDDRMHNLVQLITNVRDIAAKEKKFQVYTNTYMNNYVDECILIKEMAVTLVSIASVVVLSVLLVFIPNLFVATCVFSSILSIQLGVVGFMSLWGVSLDPVSLVGLIMCVGFSVDFASHFSYFFASCTENEVYEKIRSTLYAVGLPIVQGAVSSMIAAIPLYFVPSYSFVIAFKIVALVMIFSLLHALFVLPTILAIVDHVKKRVWV